MKTIKFALLIILSMIIISCSNNDNKPDAYGQFEANEIIIASEVQGQIIKWDIEEGQYYQANQLLGIIDTTSLNLKKLQLISQKKAINAKSSNITTQINVLLQQKNNLEVEKERFTKLVSQNAATQKQLDDIINNIKIIDKQIDNVKSQEQLVSAEAETITYQIKQIEDQLAKSYIKMPIDGIILEKYIENRELVVPGKAILKVANLSKMYFKCYIDEEQLTQVKLGQNVKVFVDGKDGLKEYNGVVSWISSQAEFSPKIIQNRDERKNLVYALKIAVINDGSLKIGMLGDVKF